MKKNILYSIIIFFTLSLIVGIENTKAEPMDKKVLDYLSFTNTYGLTDSEVTSLMQEAGKTESQIERFLIQRNYAKNNTSDGNYYITLESYERTYLNLSSELPDAFFQITKTNDNSMELGYYMGITFHCWVSRTDQRYYTYNSNTKTMQQGSKAQWVTFAYIDLNMFNTNMYNSIDRISYYFYETNSETNIRYQKQTNNDYLGDLIIDNTTYTINTHLPYYLNTGVNSMRYRTPTIRFYDPIDTKNENNEIIKSAIAMSVNYYDPNKHIVQYALMSSDWNEYINDYEFTDIIYNGTSWNYTSNINDTIIVRIIDSEKYYESADSGQELVIDILDMATYTFPTITEELPNISMKITTPEGCTYSLQGQNGIACQLVSTSISNYNLGTQQIFWSTDTINWYAVYTNEFTYTAYENLTYYVKIVNRKTNELITSSTAIIHKIGLGNLSDYEISQLGQYVTFKGKFDNKKNEYKLDILFYNFDSENYNYYYKLNEYDIDFTQIHQSNVDIASNGIATFKTTIYVNCTVIAKVEDKQGNYVDAATFTINQFETKLEDTKNVIHSFLNDIKDNLRTMSELMQYFYDRLNVNIQRFLVAVFSFAMICSIIILARGGKK